MDTLQPFRVSGKDICVDMLGSARGALPVWIPAGVGAVGAAAGFIMSDPRLIAAGLMLLLAVAPSAGFFMYYVRVCSSGIVENILPHTIEHNEVGYVVTIYRKVVPDEESDASDPVLEVSHSVTLRRSSLARVRKYLNFDVLHFDSEPISVLYVPADMSLTVDYENIKKYK